MSTNLTPYDSSSRRTPTELDGFINLNKPSGITSAKALYKVRSITGKRKSGHSGTLDPAATGVLVLCLGKATKLVEQIMDQPKVYRAKARLDVTSESYDSDRPLIPVAVTESPTFSAVRDACRSLTGNIEQVPPRISAIKVGGRRAYERVRKNQPVELSPRPVQVYWLHLHSYCWPEIEFELACGRGTYVRSLIRDLGAELGTGGCLTSLTRVSVGPFHESDAWSLESLSQASGPGEYLIDLPRAREMLSDHATVIPRRPGETSERPTVR